MNSESASRNGAEASLRCIDVSRIARPFRAIFIANYCMLIFGGGLALFAGEVIVNLVFTRQAAGHNVIVRAFYLYLLGAGVYGAWEGWQNRGALDVLTRRHWAGRLMLVATIFALPALLLAFVWIPAVTDDAAAEDLFILLFMTGSIAGTAALSVVALAYAGALRVPALDLKLSAFLRRIKSYAQRHPLDLKLPPQNRKLGILFVVLGVLYFIGLRWVPDKIFGENINYEGTLGAFGFMLLIYARQYFQPDFNTVIAADKRPPILFLRSFADDEKLRSAYGVDSQVFDFSLESRLGGHFSALGPFVAVGAPKDKNPHLGAARATLTDEEWQGRVVQWMGESQVVILMAGTTRWIDWELKKTLDLGYSNKLIILFPQIRKWRKKKDAELRLRALRNAFAGTIWENALGLLGTQRGTAPLRNRSIVLEPAGGVVAVTSSTRSRDSYHLAALISHYLITDEKTEVAPAIAPAAIPEGDRVAGIGRRLIAAALDSVLLFIPYASIGTAVAARTGMITDDGFSLSRPATAAVIAVSLAIALLYYWIGEGIWGATMGKKIAGVRVQRRSGGPCGLGRSLIRNLIRIVDLAGGFLIALFPKQHRRVGDYAAGTLVMECKPRHATRAVMFGIWLALIVGGIALIGELYNSAPDWACVNGDFDPLATATSTGHLQVGNVRLVEKRGGPARSSTVYKPGEKVFIDYLIIGYGRDATGKADLHLEWSVVDATGASVFAAPSSKYNKSIGKGSPVDYYQGVELSERTDPGDYRIIVKVHDNVANTDIEFTIGFSVAR